MWHMWDSVDSQFPGGGGTRVSELHRLRHIRFLYKEGPGEAQGVSIQHTACLPGLYLL